MSRQNGSRPAGLNPSGYRGNEVYMRALEIKKKEPTLPFSAIGERLGYGRPASFGSSFRSWAKRNHLWPIEGIE